MAAKKTRKDPSDAITMLTTDHEKVHALFEEFAELQDSGTKTEKSAIVKKICDELTIHATIEEEIFYPAVRTAIDDADLMDEALVEHACAKDLIAQLESADPKNDLYDAKVTVLGETDRSSRGGRRRQHVCSGAQSEARHRNPRCQNT